MTPPYLATEGRGTGRSVGTNGSRKKADERRPRGIWGCSPQAQPCPGPVGLRTKRFLSSCPGAPGRTGSGLGSPWRACGSAGRPQPEASLSRGLLAMGFLDPIQTPFNYPRQMAVLVVGGNRIRVPGDSGSRGTAARPASEEDSSPLPTSPQPTTEPVCQDRRAGVTACGGHLRRGLQGPGVEGPPGIRPGSLLAPCISSGALCGQRQPTSLSKHQGAVQGADS